MHRTIFVLVFAIFLAGCAESPFIEKYPSSSQGVVYSKRSDWVAVYCSKKADKFVERIFEDKSDAILFLQTNGDVQPCYKFDNQTLAKSEQCSTWNTVKGPKWSVTNGNHLSAPILEKEINDLTVRIERLEEHEKTKKSPTK